VFYAVILIAVPALISSEVKPFWRDDVMIIGLGIFTFIIFGHSVEAPEEAADLSSDEAIK
jgi:ABC-type transport system involved in multi-copper enzyme maturation permease subunit